MSNEHYRKITVQSQETGYCYTEITNNWFRKLDQVIWEHEQRGWDIEFLDFQEVIISPKELTLELLKMRHNPEIIDLEAAQ